MLSRPNAQMLAAKPHGNDTPSSRQPFRPDAPEAKVARKGGAKPGHDGHGRHCAGEDEADEVVELAKPVASRQHLGVWASEHSGVKASEQLMWFVT